MIKVLIVDDHIIFREGVKSLLSKYKNIEVVGSVENGLEAVDFVTKNRNVDIVLMDVNMPRMDGIEATKIITKHHDKIKVIILSMYDNDMSVRKAVFAGASGYLTKDSDLQHVYSAIEFVFMGGTYFEPTLARSFYQKAKIDLSDKKIESFDNFGLSKKEIEILKLICQGKTSSEIGVELNISQRTIDVHRFNIMKKTKTANIAQLIVFAIENGIYKVDIKI